jgi:LuxR family quorum sensing-dependent transcriptional regulator
MDLLAHRLLDLSHDWSRAAPGRAGAERLHALLSGHGLRMLAARIYPTAMPNRGSAALWRAGGFLETRSPEGWADSDELAYICVDNNPLIAAPQQGVSRFRFSHYAKRGTRSGDAYWEAWSRARVDEGVGLIAYGLDGRTASLSMGFERFDELSPIAVEATTLVGQALIQSLLRTETPEPPERPALTAREREVMRLVTRGLTDADIARVLAIGPTTARAHVDNARRKLDAANRIEAAVLFAATDTAG